MTSKNKQLYTPKRKKCGFNEENMPIDTTKLLEEAQSWDPNIRINWTELGTKYGLTIANRGQVIKEFLSQHDIPAACTQQRPNRAPRQSKKKLPGGCHSQCINLYVSRNRKLQTKSPQEKFG